MRTQPSKETFQINRIAGCYGDIETARKKIVAPSGLLRDPYFSEDEYRPSVFAFQKENPVCVLGNQPHEVQSYEGHIDSLWDYAYADLNCECGDCYGENDRSFPDSELNSNITAEITQKYAVYVERRKKEIKKGQENHQRYMEDYQVWHNKRTTEMSPVAIHMRVTTDKDIPAGSLTVYNFVWQEFWGCEGLYSAQRERLQTRIVQHPPLKAGESLDIWLENVDINLSWGIVMHDKQQDVLLEQQAIIEHAENVQMNNEAKERENWLPLRTLPAFLDGRIYETPHARSTISGSDCGCSC